MRPDERTATRKPRRWMFKAWIAVGIAGGLFIMFGAPFTSRYFGHEVVAIADLVVVMFLTVTGLGWLVYLAMSKRRARPDTTAPGEATADRAPGRRKPQ